MELLGQITDEIARLVGRFGFHANISFGIAQENTPCPIHGGDPLDDNTIDVTDGNPN